MKTLSSQLWAIAFVLVAMPTFITSCSSDDDIQAVSVDNFTAADLVGTWRQRITAYDEYTDTATVNNTTYAFDAEGNVMMSIGEKFIFANYCLAGHVLKFITFGGDTTQLTIDSISPNAIYFDYDDDVLIIHLERKNYESDFCQYVETLPDDSIRSRLIGELWSVSYFGGDGEGSFVMRTLKFADDGTFVKGSLYGGETLASGTYLVKDHRIFLYNTLGVTGPDIEVLNLKRASKNGLYFDAVSPDGSVQVQMMKTAQIYI